MSQGYVEKSLAPQKADIEKINEFTRSDFDSDSLYVFNVVLCDNDIDRDFEKFDLEALYQLKDLFVGKTGIFDHSMKSSDQKARIFDTFVERVPGRLTADGDEYCQLKAKAYMVKSQENMPLITEIEAGIKKEVSVSCSAGKSTCSICGSDKRKGCEHINGREYGGKTAFSVLSDIKDAYEFSFVAVPAQRGAGVTKSFDCLKKGENMTEIIKSLRECKEETVLSKAQAGKIAAYIEELEEEAQLGRDYKKNLAGEVVALCSKAMPEMDLKVFGNVVQVMTAKELNAFKKAFSAGSCNNSAALQIKPEKTTGNVNQFKI